MFRNATIYFAGYRNIVFNDDHGSNPNNTIITSCNGKEKEGIRSSFVSSKYIAKYPNGCFNVSSDGYTENLFQKNFIVRNLFSNNVFSFRIGSFLDHNHTELNYVCPTSTHFVL